MDLTVGECSAGPRTPSPGDCVILSRGTYVPVAPAVMQADDTWHVRLSFEGSTVLMGVCALLSLLRGLPVVDVERSDLPAAFPVLWPCELGRSTTYTENLCWPGVHELVPVLFFLSSGSSTTALPCSTCFNCRSVKSGRLVALRAPHGFCILSIYQWSVSQDQALAITESEWQICWYNVCVCV